MADRQKIITLDARRRASLAKIGRPEHTRYIVDVQDDGTMILTPAVVVPIPGTLAANLAQADD